MSTCKKLAEQYATESGIAIPPITASVEEKQNWLLISEWGCIPPGTTTVLTSPACKDQNDKQSDSTNVTVRPPMLNYLQESGFLHWVNQRGMQCINGMVGRFYGLNTNTGTSNSPGPSVSPPNSRCWGACYLATTESSMCFECVKEVLLADPSVCPALDMHNPANENMVRDSIGCHECIANQSKFIQSASSPPNTPDLNAMMNNIWKCITGTVPKSLSDVDIIVIVIISVFVSAVAITLGLYFGYFHPKIVKSEATRLKLLQAGLNPTDY